jgi:hypothetical protein
LPPFRQDHAASRNDQPGEYSTTASIALTEQFLAWVAQRPRTYGEAMEAWRSTCPHLSIWEDAVRDGLVRLENGGSMKSSRGETSWR